MQITPRNDKTPSAEAPGVSSLGSRVDQFAGGRHENTSVATVLIATSRDLTVEMSSIGM